MDRIVLVTGGSRGIGRAIAERFLSLGDRVVVTGLRPPEEVSPPEGALYVSSSIASAEDRKHALSFVLERFGRLDVLVNNAGMAPRVRNDLLEMTEESFREVMTTNLEGPFFLTQEAARHMEAQGGGVIVNITSISAEAASTDRGEYCMSKAALSMMTRLFALRMAASGVRVYEVRPGIVRTDMTAKVQQKYDALFAQGLLPINRWGEPDDVAKAVCLLASGDLPYSTGEIFYVDGGRHLPRI